MPAHACMLAWGVRSVFFYPVEELYTFRAFFFSQKNEKKSTLNAFTSNLKPLWETILFHVSIGWDFGALKGLNQMPGVLLVDELAHVPHYPE